MLGQSLKIILSVLCVILIIINALYTWINVEHSLTGYQNNIYAHQCEERENMRKPNCQRIIIIIAYGRSGSTFLASILQDTVRSFYLFEPARAVKFLPQSDFGVFSLLRDTKRNPWMQYPLLESEEKMIYAFNLWVNCNLSSICIPQLKDDKSTPNKHGCCGKGLSRNETDTSQLLCLNDEEIYCSKSTIKIFKFIRMRMKLVLQLLKLFPNLKIIHLVRDPRGIMNSRINQTQVKLLSVMKLCEDLKNDLAYSKIILSQYPDNIYIVNYEDLATNTIETAKTIFKFVNLRFTNAIKQSLLLKTQASRDTCRFCVIRRNSSETSSKWRMNLDLDSVNYVYKACKLSNQVLGYLPFTDIKTLRNLNLPSRKLVVIKSNMLSNKQLHI